MRSSRRLAQFNLAELKHRLAELTADSPEAPAAAAASAGADPRSASDLGALRGIGPGRTPALDQFTTNLTERAEEGKLDPMIGRGSELDRAIHILARRR